MRCYLPLLVAVVAAGCAQQNPQPAIITPSGRPEVTIDAPAGRIESALVTACAASLRGKIGSAGPAGVDCTDLPPTLATSFWSALNESQVGGHTDDVVHFQLIDLGDGTVRVLASRELTAYNAFGAVLDRATFSRYDADVQRVLEAAKSSAEAEALAHLRSAANPSGGSGIGLTSRDATSAAQPPVAVSRQLQRDPNDTF